jgi:serine protease inhibitor
MTYHLALGLPVLLASALLGASGDIAPAFNRFAAVTYRELSKQPGNLILSPFNISTALSMLLAGARGRTAAGIAAALQTGAGPGYDAAVAALCAQLTKQASLGSNQLAMANGVWVESGLAIEPAFENTIKSTYQASLTPLDFREHNEQARQQINSWTARQTHEKITDLFKAGRSSETRAWC